MLKILILAAVAVWFLGLFLGKRRRVIRDTTHLLSFILWVVLLFLGGTMLPRMALLDGSPLLLGAAVAVWYFVSFFAARWLSRFFSKS